jgi:hypothetical protein
MITEFGGFKLGDRVAHKRCDATIGTVISFDHSWLQDNPDADVFDVGVIWDENQESPLIQVEIDWQSSNKLEKVPVAADLTFKVAQKFYLSLLDLDPHLSIAKDNHHGCWAITLAFMMQGQLRAILEVSIAENRRETKEFWNKAETLIQECRDHYESVYIGLIKKLRI